ncbi:hypothetical protein HN803_03490, partial [candidate division WWE3 bacterium]|nr:hypothetical protein [candidate division WWE3 bacterium]
MNMRKALDVQKDEGQPKFVFIAGTPRSSHSVTTASLDDHPDVLALPFEFLYFPFFYRVAAGRKEVPVAELNHELIKVSFKNFRRRLGHGDGIYVDDISNSLVDNCSVGDFDFQLFLRCLQSGKVRCFNAVDYLTFLFKCL